MSKHKWIFNLNNTFLIPITNSLSFKSLLYSRSGYLLSRERGTQKICSKFQTIWFHRAWDISSFMRGTYKKSPWIMSIKRPLMTVHCSENGPILNYRYENLQMKRSRLYFSSLYDSDNIKYDHIKRLKRYLSFFLFQNHFRLNILTTALAECEPQKYTERHFGRTFRAKSIQRNVQT